MVLKMSAWGMMGLVLLALSATPATASEATPFKRFDWMANGVKVGTASDRLQEARRAIAEAQVLRANATWVCTPAGFGQRSHCVRG